MHVGKFVFLILQCVLSDRPSRSQSSVKEIQIQIRRMKYVADKKSHDQIVHYTYGAKRSTMKEISCNRDLV